MLLLLIHAYSRKFISAFYPRLSIQTVVELLFRVYHVHSVVNVCGRALISWLSSKEVVLISYAGRVNSGKR